MNLNINGYKQDFDELKKNDPEKWFRLILNKQDFKGLNHLYCELEGIIHWEYLTKEGICKIEKGKLLGIYWNKDLNLGAFVVSTLFKFKEITGNVVLFASSLEDIGELEKVRLDLDLRGTNVSSIRNLKEVGGDLNIKSINIDLQLEVLNKINDGSLKVGGKIKFGGINVDLKKLLKYEKIPGDLILDGETLDNVKEIGGDLDATSVIIKLQLELIEKVNTGLLKLDGELFIVLYLENYFINQRELNFKNLEEKFGTNISKIDDVNMQWFAKRLLIIEYKRVLKMFIDNVKSAKDKKEIIKMNNQLTILKDKISNFGLNIESIDVSDIIN